MPGRTCGFRALPRPPRAELQHRRPRTSSRCTRTRPTCGVEYQLERDDACSAVNYVHNNLDRTIEDVGSLDASGNEVYFAANPGEGIATTMFSTGLTAPTPTPKPKRIYDALDVTPEPSLLAATGLPARTSRSAGCTATTPVWPTRTKSPRPPPASRRPPPSSRAAASRVPARRPAARGTSTSSNGIRTATSTSSAAWPPIVRSSRSSTARTRSRSARRSARSSTSAAARR